MLFGVSDEITGMTTSLEMVVRKILIYRVIVFGHRKCFGGYRVLIGSLKEFRASPSKLWALWAK